MKLRSWIAAGVLCLLCCTGIESVYAQKMYKEGDAIVLDCGPGSGFPQGAVEMQKGKKVAAGTPSDNGGPMANNTETESINKTVYHKLEVAAKDVPDRLTWANAYSYCTGLGEGWRLPTQRELMLIWIFKDAVVGLGGVSFAVAYYWSSTERYYYNSWYLYFSPGNTESLDKTDARNVRCVREM